MSGKRDSLPFSNDDFDHGDVVADALPAPAIAFSQAPWQLTESADAAAKGGASGGGGGGHGGGGSGGVVTTYTSGNPNVDNASEFNIKINFTGTWTAQQQAVVEWAADF